MCIRDSYKTSTSEKYDRIITRFACELTHPQRNRETPLGNLISDILRDSFENVKTKVGMPSNVDAKRMAGFHAPSLVIAGDRDCMFPASRVLPRARQILANCQTIELKGSGHMHILPEDVKRTIVEFLL